MQRFILGVLAVALLGAGATVFLVDRYIDSRIASNASATKASIATIRVLVAKKNIPIGKKVEGSDLDWQSWPESGVQTDFVSSTKADRRKATLFLGTVTRRGIIKGTPITKNSVFNQNRPGFLAGALDPNMRAMAIAITAQSGAAGFILPGDRVDVILTQNARKKTGRGRRKAGASSRPRVFLSHVAETILQNVRVLAADQKVDDFKKTAKVSKTVTLEVTQKQAEMLAVAVSMGKLSLALRSLSDVANDKAAEMARKKAIAEAIHAAKGPTKTTDLEVSPVLAATAGAEEAAASAKKMPKVENNKGLSGQVKVYRDGAPSMVKF